MSLKKYLPVVLTFITAGIVALVAAIFSTSAVEEKSLLAVNHVLELHGYTWVETDVDGLLIVLHGEASDEATRFQALTTASTVVDSARIIDMIDVADRGAIEPPRFSVEILQNDEGISLIGLVPSPEVHDDIIAAIGKISNDQTVTDLLDVGNYPTPHNWYRAQEFGVSALEALSRSKISISADRVDVRAISDSATEKRRFEAELARKAPDGVSVTMDISAPRPVITPFTLRFIIDSDGPRFDACSTDTKSGRANILAAATKTGLQGKTDCKIGLGVPSPNWDAAVIAGIEKLAELGGGTLTFSDADITLIAMDTTPQSTFDRVVGELEAALPEVFSLHAVLPDPPEQKDKATQITLPEFVATRSPEGQIQLRGRIQDERTRLATESYARAQFGSKHVNSAMRLDENLPTGWTTRVLASIEALSFLNNGSVITKPNLVEIRGATGDPDAKSEISRILSEKLGESEDYRISVTYDKKLDPLLNLPTAEECVRKINIVLGVRQITFAPSSADIDEEAQDTLDQIAKIMKDCEDFPMEIGGHTDSQGREIMNQTLSQSRADAVLNALLSRRILTTNLQSKGYGESVPVADNKTEAGRELNRRIEFTLIPGETAQTADEGETSTPDVIQPETTNTEITDE